MKNIINTVFIGIMIILAGISLCSCVKSDNNETETFKSCKNDFECINQLLLEKAQGEKVNYGIVKNQEGIIIGLSCYSDSVELDQAQAQAMNNIDSIFKMDFSFIEITKNRISYGGLGSKMYVYSMNGKKPDYFYSDDSNDVSFSTYKVENDWYLLLSVTR